MKNRAITIEKTNNDLALKASEIIEMNKELQSEKGERAKLEVQIEKQIEIITDIQLKFEMQTTTALKEKEERCKLKTEIQKKTEIINEIKMELEEKRCALDQEKEERIKLDATLQTLKRDFEIESDTAKENERELKKRVSELEAKIRVIFTYFNFVRWSFIHAEILMVVLPKRKDLVIVLQLINMFK